MVAEMTDKLIPRPSEPLVAGAVLAMPGPRTVGKRATRPTRFKLAVNRVVNLDITALVQEKLEMLLLCIDKITL